MNFSGEKMNTFDKEAFKKELADTIQKYVDSFDLRKYNKTDAEKQDFSLEQEKIKQKMITDSVQALKLSSNKEEVLSIINDAFWDSGRGKSAIQPGNFTSGRGIENFYKDVILELVKKGV